MTYYIAGVAALRQEFFHGAKNAAVPFDLGDDAQTVTKIDKEAAKSGIAKRDVLERLNGAPYTGLAQLSDFRAHSKPGDPIRLTFRTPDGRAKNVETPLLPVEGPNFSLGEYFAFLTPVLFVPLLSLIVGYWIVAARPRDPNAWLVLFLLTFPEIGFANLDWKFWGGASSTVLGVWNFTQTYLLQLALLWFGVYFPERWRVDIRWPAVKWTITAVVLAAFSLNLWLAGLQYFDVAALAPLLPLESWTNQVSGWSAILCSALFLAAIFDKLRSASTPDARRRLRILAVGSTISLGGMVLMIGLLPRLGFSPPEWLLLSVDIPVFILFPLTLAYVVVVQRAMDIRILLRMGTKYLIAKATLVVLQIVFVLVLIFGVDIPIVERHVHKTTFVLIAVSVAIVAFLIRRSAAGKKISVGNRLHAWLDRKFFREAYNAEMVLSELSEHARRFTERDPLIETVSRRISEVLHVPQVAVWLRGSNVFHLQQAVGFDVPGPVLLAETSSTVQNLARTNRPATVYRDRPAEWLAQAEPGERLALDTVQAELLLPLPGRDRLMGLIALGPKKSEEPYTPTDLRVLQSVATQTGLALEVSELAHSLAAEAAQRERINREIEIAREVQQRFFPQQLPQIPGVTLAGFCRPALGVGGDYYDLIELEDGRLGIAVGDVSGKGISAALLMASLRASLRGMTLEGPSDLAKMMYKINRLVYEASASNRYATFFFATYDPATRQLRYVNGGHNPPMLVRANGTLERLEAGGLVVGLLPLSAYEEQSLVLQPGDVLVTYTDGISEAMSHDDEEWGEERMLEAIEQARRASAENILNALFQAADQFTAEAPQHDDMTLLILKLDPAPTEPRP